MGKQNSQAGFTFVEILLGVVIATLMALALIAFMQVSATSHITATESMEEIWDSRSTMDYISEDLKYAISAEPAADGLSLTYKCPSDTNNRRLFLNDDNKLCITNDSGTTIISDKAITQLNCSYHDTEKTAIDITIKFSDKTTLSTTVKLLNEGGN